jgi:hypothetical protein
LWPTDFVWAIVSNITVAFKDFNVANNQETPTANMVGREGPSVLRIADWIPSYGRDDFTQHADERKDQDCRSARFNKRACSCSDGSNVTMSVCFPCNRPLDAKLLNVYIDRISATDTLPNQVLSKDIASRLFDQGEHFLYGMLIHEVMSLAPYFGTSKFLSSSVVDATKTDDFTIALDFDSSQSDLSVLRKCFEPTLTLTLGSPCHVYMLRDNKDIAVHDWIQSKNCTVINAKSLNVVTLSQKWSNNSDNKNNAELYSNLYWISGKVRSAYIGYRSNPISKLLYDGIEYKRRMEIWKRGQDPPDIPILPHCFLDTEPKIRKLKIIDHRAL